MTETVRITELAIYGGEREVEFQTGDNTIFISIGGLCIEVDQELFEAGMLALTS